VPVATLIDDTIATSTTTGTLNADNANIGGTLSAASVQIPALATLTGKAVVGIGTDGRLTTAVTADNLANGSTNLFATKANTFTLLADNTTGLLKNNSSAGGITWTFTGSPTYSITGALTSLNTSQITDNSGAFVSAANVGSFWRHYP